MAKLVTIDELARITQELRSKGKTVVLCHGIFDLLHPGHFKHLKAAKREGDVLIVTVTPDRYVNKGPGRPLYDENLRAETLCDLADVDYVAINQWATAVETIKLLKPGVYAKGNDYARQEDDVTGAINEEEAAAKSIGGKIHFTNEISFSSTKIINRFLNPYPETARAFLEECRKKYVVEYVIRAIQSLKKLKVLIIGETIIDEYLYCQGMGKTTKDNIIAVRYINEEAFAGGVLAAANHVAGFCQNVDLVTCIGGKADYAEFIISHLKPNIRAKFFHHVAGSTIVKRRFVEPAFLSKLFEVAYIDEKLPEGLETAIADYIYNVLAEHNYDVVLVTDYGHGFINNKLAHVISDSGEFLAVNTQANSANSGFNVITKYPRANYICLDEPELRLACREKYDTPEHLVEDISGKLGCRAVSITQGHRGCLTYDGKTFYKIPALTDHTVDRMGAGDCYLSLTSPCVAAGLDMDLVGFIGNAAAALKTQTVGNKESIQPAALFKFIQALLK